MVFFALPWCGGSTESVEEILEEDGRGESTSERLEGIGFYYYRAIVRGTMEQPTPP